MRVSFYPRLYILSRKKINDTKNYKGYKAGAWPRSMVMYKLPAGYRLTWNIPLNVLLSCNILAEGYKEPLSHAGRNLLVVEWAFYVTNCLMVEWRMANVSIYLLWRNKFAWRTHEGIV